MQAWSWEAMDFSAFSKGEALRVCAFHKEKQPPKVL
jgi:hypothetical protein